MKWSSPFELIWCQFSIIIKPNYVGTKPSYGAIGNDLVSNISTTFDTQLAQGADLINFLVGDWKGLPGPPPNGSDDILTRYAGLSLYLFDIFLYF